jgi:RNA polymerase sigma factor (TIGR02999 family)
MTPAEKDVTQLLMAWSEGKSGALETLIPQVYDAMHRIAQYHMRGQRPGHTLQATALVHEAFLKLTNVRDPAPWMNREHFLGVASITMKRVLVDHARKGSSEKRKGLKVSLDEGAAVPQDCAAELVALDDALKQLEEVDPRKAKVLGKRYFDGKSVEETAQELAVSPDTVLRDCRLAKAWLRRELSRT